MQAERKTLPGQPNNFSTNDDRSANSYPMPSAPNLDEIYYPDDIPTRPSKPSEPHHPDADKGAIPRLVHLSNEKISQFILI